MAAEEHPGHELTAEVVGLMGELVAAFHQDYENAAADHSLTAAQAKVLALLAREPQPMRHLAERLSCEPSNITGIVDRLENRGLVERIRGDRDRRVKLVRLTDPGRTAAEDLRCTLGFARAPLAALSPAEREQLRDLLRRTLEAARPAEPAQAEIG
jgi:DNA-binding MarR family transcriptional regulator